MLNELNGLLRIELCLVNREDIYDKSNKLLEYLNKKVVTLAPDDNKKYEIDSDLRSIFYCLANLCVDLVRLNDLNINNISYYIYMYIELIDSLWDSYGLNDAYKMVL